MYVTPRTLLAIIRLAQAMAKLHFRNEVRQFDVDEAIKLMDFSIKSLRNLKGGKDVKKNSNKDQENKDKMSKIISAVREIVEKEKDQQFSAAEILKRLIKDGLGMKGLKKEELMDVLNYYKRLQVIYMDEHETVVFL
jgi:DNA replication licensing factor MCM7